MKDSTSAEDSTHPRDLGSGLPEPAGDTPKPVRYRNLAMDRRPCGGSSGRLMTRSGDGLDMANIRPTAPAEYVDAGKPVPELGALATKLVGVPIIEIRRVIEFGVAHA